MESINFLTCKFGAKVSMQISVYSLHLATHQINFAVRSPINADAYISHALAIFFLTTTNPSTATSQLPTSPTQLALATSTSSTSMGAARRGHVLGVCAVVLMAIAARNAEAASVVVGLAKCGDCTRKNMKAEEAFKGLHVAIKCRNSNGEYESKAVGELDGTGAFSVPLAADLHGADCHAQLHSAATNAACPGQEPSKVVPLSDEEGTYGVVAGKTHYASSSECASATMCGHMKKIFDHFHKKPVPPKPEPKPQPHPDYHPVPPSTPTYGGQPSSPTPIYHPPAQH